MTETNLIPDSVREQLLSVYGAAVRDSPGVYRALQARGELRQLDAVAVQYAEVMVGEVEKLCRQYELKDEIGRLGFWPAWRTFVPAAMKSEPGREWLPSRSVAFSAPAASAAAKQDALSTEVVGRKPMGFQPPVASPLLPAPAVAAGLSAADLERIVVAAVSAAVKQPPVINVTMPKPDPPPDVEVLDGSGKVISRTRRVKK